MARLTSILMLCAAETGAELTDEELQEIRKVVSVNSRAACMSVSKISRLKKVRCVEVDTASTRARSGVKEQ